MWKTYKTLRTAGSSQARKQMQILPVNSNHYCNNRKRPLEIRNNHTRSLAARSVSMSISNHSLQLHQYSNNKRMHLVRPTLEVKAASLNNKTRLVQSKRSVNSKWAVDLHVSSGLRFSRAPRQIIQTIIRALCSKCQQPVTLETPTISITTTFNNSSSKTARRRMNQRSGLLKRARIKRVQIVLISTIYLMHYRMFLRVEQLVGL